MWLIFLNVAIIFSSVSDECNEIYLPWYYQWNSYWNNWLYLNYLLIIYIYQIFHINKENICYTFWNFFVQLVITYNVWIHLYCFQNILFIIKNNLRSSSESHNLFLCLRCVRGCGITWWKTRYSHKTFTGDTANQSTDFKEVRLRWWKTKHKVMAVPRKKNNIVKDVFKIQELRKKHYMPSCQERILYLFFSQKVNKQHLAGYLHLVGYVAKHIGNLYCNENPPPSSLGRKILLQNGNFRTVTHLSRPNSWI